MSYAEALERLKKIEHGPGRAVTKVPKGAYGTYGTRDPGPSQNFKPSGTYGGCQSKALSESPLPNAEILESATPGSAKSARTMPGRAELERICRLAVAGYPSVSADTLAGFLIEAQDPAWCTERVARHLARRMQEGLIRWEPER